MFFVMKIRLMPNKPESRQVELSYAIDVKLTDSYGRILEKI